jgi:hypothetical protein
VPGGLALGFRKSKALTDNLEAHYQPANDPSELEIIEMIHEAMHAYQSARASEPKLNSSSEVPQAINELEVTKALDPNGAPHEVLSPKSKTPLFIKTARRIQKPRPISFFKSQYSGSKQYGIFGQILIRG